MGSCQSAQESKAEMTFHDAEEKKKERKDNCSGTGVEPRTSAGQVRPSAPPRGGHKGKMTKDERRWGKKVVNCNHAGQVSNVCLKGK